MTKYLDETGLSHLWAKIKSYVAQQGGGGLTVDDIYPVGSIYMSVNNTNPNTLFTGTTWVQIKDRFLLSAGDTYTGGTTGGSANAVVVSHTHPTASNGYLYMLTHGALSGGDMGSQSGSGRHYPYQGNRSDGAYWGSQANTGAASSGVSGTGKNMPPYLVVYMWQRTA